MVTGRKRGELRIYLGAAPGVGKTFAMLGEAHRRVERGADVVVGLVETHGRARTAALLDGLEQLPQRETWHRGVRLAELDVDAVLARSPEVVVVDELAHTNAPGSHNLKRWQDVEQLLDAGVNVLSTVNVQHLESLNDVVERITGVPQRETVPDEVVRRAEQVELVDLTPEALRRRLAHGNVYAADKVDAALANYFRVGNLTALRELALLWVADQVDVALQRYRSEQHITETWEARERVVVAITGGPESDTLIRRARRIAVRAGAELLVVHVLRGDGLVGVPLQRVAGFRRVAEDLGATFHNVVGDDVPSALLEFARGVNATQLVLGTSRRSRWARVFDEGIGSAVVGRSGSIDVHMVTHDEARRGVRWGTGSPSLRGRRRLVGWLLSVAAPLLVTGIGTLWRDDLSSATDLMGFFLAIVVVALVGGLGPALVAAFFGAGLLNYYFTEPLYSLTVAEPENLVTLVVMVVVAVLVALVVDRAARLGEQGARARTEAALLASYSRTVLAAAHPLARLLEKVRENFGLESVALLERLDGAWTRVACVGARPCSEPDEADVDVPVTANVHLALRGRTLPAADQRVLEAAAGQAVLALRQQRMAAEAADARRQAETTSLRTALLSAVGHDLRTPLTSIKASVGALRSPELTLSPQDVAELLETVEVSADRLTALVDNLLDSSRLATGAVTPLLRPVTYDEVVARALTGLDRADEVLVEVSESLPPVLADVGLLERVVANVIDNGLRHGRTRVAVRASAHGARVELRVVDHGPGLPRDTASTAFAPFQRLGDRDATPGIGLGLNVAKGFVEAMDGVITAEDTPGGGLTVVVSLPCAGEDA
ncbi:sensor histidine kinase KdpD [Actinosynnema sp. NPDC020468]|uniref:sensor histidine kinase KdpD n=1 Tax=Actinosynnema sp. NPDC020468 TaxID=3154488 RepID=UPI003411E599